MRDRQKSLQRLLAVKSQLHRLDEARLIETQRQKQALADDRRAMFDLLGKAETPDSLLLGLACRHIQRTEAGERDLAAIEKAQTLALLHRSAQKKALEKSLMETRLALDRDAERRVLLELGERLAAPRKTSFGQV